MDLAKLPIGEIKVEDVINLSDRQRGALMQVGSDALRSWHEAGKMLPLEVMQQILSIELTSNNAMDQTTLSYFTGILNLLEASQKHLAETEELMRQGREFLGQTPN